MQVNDFWYTQHPLSRLLAPLGYLFCGIVAIRRNAYQLSLLRQQRLSVPIVIVGNITVGGTGKTPLVIWLADFLRQSGYKPGIVSRGYRGKTTKTCQVVFSYSDPYLVGDEPVLLAQRSGCPVAIAKKRFLGAQLLVSAHQCNIIICDDGLQHYALHRDLEIAVVDDVRRFGNQRCLPVGPLREPIKRLKSVHFLVTRGHASNHGFSMQYEDTNTVFNVYDARISQPLSDFRDQWVHAIAGIGYPEKFFNRLRSESLKVHSHAFPDHHFYTQRDIQFNDSLPVIMTEKDAVKCTNIANAKHWYLPITAHLPVTFGEQLLQLINAL